MKICFREVLMQYKQKGKEETIKCRERQINWFFPWKVKAGQQKVFLLWNTECISYFELAFMNNTAEAAKRFRHYIYPLVFCAYSSAFQCIVQVPAFEYAYNFLHSICFHVLFSIALLRCSASREASPARRFHCKWEQTAALLTIWLLDMVQIKQSSIQAQKAPMDCSCRELQQQQHGKYPAKKKRKKNCWKPNKPSKKNSKRKATLEEHSPNIEKQNSSDIPQLKWYAYIVYSLYYFICHSIPYMSTREDSCVLAVWAFH